MTVRQRTKALATGPGEKLRLALGLEENSTNCGTCAQLARAASQWKTLINGRPDLWPLGRYCGKESTLRIRIEGLVRSFGATYATHLTGAQIRVTWFVDGNAKTILI
jgi:hypothetical protein